MIVENIQVSDDWIPVVYEDSVGHPIKDAVRYYNRAVYVVLNNGITTIGVFDIISAKDKYVGHWVNCNGLEFTKKVIAWKEIHIPKALE